MIEVHAMPMDAYMDAYPKLVFMAVRTHAYSYFIPTQVLDCYHNPFEGVPARPIRTRPAPLPVLNTGVAVGRPIARALFAKGG